MTSGAAPIELRLMNDFVVADIPLWGDEGPTDGSELRLSDELLTDLAAFADRWNASLDDESIYRRWNGPAMKSLAATRRLASPSRRRAAKTEDAEMRQIGEELRRRLQRELGADYVVTYQH